MTYKGAITSGVEKNTSDVEFFLGFIVKFFRQVVVIMSDVEPQKVKTYLFLQGSDLTFRGSARIQAEDRFTQTGLLRNTSTIMANALPKWFVAE